MGAGKSKLGLRGFIVVGCCAPFLRSGWPGIAGRCYEVSHPAKGVVDHDAGETGAAFRDDPGGY